MIILGIDPGTATTGYGVISTKKDKNEKPKVIDFGCIITTPAHSPAERLKIIHEQVNILIEKHAPDIMAVEALYFFKNLKTAMPVSQAKGVILLSAAKKNIPILEFTPLQVKRTVVGYGKAEKKQIGRAVQLLFKLDEIPKPDDAADALGIAYLASLQYTHL